MTPEIAKTLADLGMNNIGISFDGTEKTHNYIRQRTDSYHALPQRDGYVARGRRQILRGHPGLQYQSRTNWTISRKT